jgi:ABC-type transporter Mla subunit MlaD
MGTLYYQGKLTFSDIAPGLNDAAAALRERSKDVGEFLSARERDVALLQDRANKLQAEVARIEQATGNANSILASAKDILTEAQGIVDKLANALNTSGIHQYYYVGAVGNMGSTVSDELSPGLRDTLIPEEVVAALILIVGGDGGVASTMGRIVNLFGQIGGDAEIIKDRYATEASGE